jgi:hypothetical protein
MSWNVVKYGPESRTIGTAIRLPSSRFQLDTSPSVHFIVAFGLRELRAI